MDNITLYHPGDGVNPDTNKVLYKNIKEFKDNGDGTITFKTQKHGVITSVLPWRLAKDVPANAEVEQPVAAAAPAGNRGRLRGF
jgi:hypothetical protein